MGYSVDFSEVINLGTGMAAVAGRVPQIVDPRFMKIGTAIRDNARGNINSKSGALAASGTAKKIGMMLVEVRFQAFNKGFNYAAAVEYGRGPIVPIRAKVLRFEVGGAVVFTKRAGPAKAQKYLERGISQAEGIIVREALGMETDLVKAIEAAL
jgi:hypothetical protein